MSSAKKQKNVGGFLWSPIIFGCSLMLMNNFFVFSRVHNKSMTSQVMRPACSLGSDEVARDSK